MYDRQINQLVDPMQNSARMEPARNPQVAHAMNHQEEAIKSLDVVLGNLESRLSPVLSVQPPQAVEKCEKIGSSVPLVSAIDMNTYALECFYKRIAILMERIEL